VPGSEAWQLPLALELPPRSLSGELSFESAAGEIPRAKLRSGILKERGPAGFVLMKGTVYLRTADGPPPGGVLKCALDPRAASGAVTGRNFTALGVQVLAGARASASVAVPRDSALRFGTVAEAVVGSLAQREVVFRVRLAERTLYEHRAVLPEEGPAFAWHTVPLPAEGGDARLVFEVEGALGRTAFLAPIVGPRAAPGARPDPRPDIVLFVADTFRADNLAAYGGRLAVTPHLDELARSGVCFTRAWSTASWTLPAHVVALLRLLPGPVHVESADSRLPQDVATVAELLARAGYRTAAFTGGGYVSARFGLDRASRCSPSTRASSTSSSPRRGASSTAPTASRCSCSCTPSARTGPTA
jgi:hypothetical protein